MSHLDLNQPMFEDQFPGFRPGVPVLSQLEGQYLWENTDKKLFYVSNGEISPVEIFVGFEDSNDDWARRAAERCIAEGLASTFFVQGSSPNANNRSLQLKILGSTIQAWNVDLGYAPTSRVKIWHATKSEIALPSEAAREACQHIFDEEKKQGKEQQKASLTKMAKEMVEVITSDQLPFSVHSPSDAVQLTQKYYPGYWLIAMNRSQTGRTWQILIAKKGLSLEALKAGLETKIGSTQPFVSIHDQLSIEHGQLIVRTQKVGTWIGTQGWRIKALKVVTNGQIEIR